MVGEVRGHFVVDGFGDDERVARAEFVSGGGHVAVGVGDGKGGVGASAVLDGDVPQALAGLQRGVFHGGRGYGSTTKGLLGNGGL